MNNTSIGFIGLGIMGKPMARNLLRAGYSLTVFNRSRPALDELAREGAHVVASPCEVAARSEVVFTMLPDSPDVEQVVLGSDGVASGLRAGGTHIDSSTIDPAVARRIAAVLAGKGIRALDAPVSGGERGAIDAMLSIMAGGSPDTFAAMLPLLRAVGKNITHIGPSGTGQVAKACNQIVVAIAIEAVAEALALAQTAEVDPARVREALLGGFASSRVLELHGQRMLDGAYEPGFKAELHRKDANIAVSLARSLDLALPAAELLLDRLTRLTREAPRSDSSALRTLLRASKDGE